MTLSDSAKFVVVFIRPLHSRRSQHKGTRREGGSKQAGVVFIKFIHFSFSGSFTKCFYSFCHDFLCGRTPKNIVIKIATDPPEKSFTH